MKPSKIWVISLFPEYFKPLLETGVAGQALSGSRGRSFEFNTIQLRDYSPKDFKGVDAAPYGGGAGMVIRADVLKNALIKGVVEEGGYGEDFREKLHIVFASPRGKIWNDEYCREFASRVWDEEKGKDLVFICGRYEGIDERFIQLYIDEQICVGDFILTCGEVATLTILDSALRFVPGVLGNKESSEHESFRENLLEHPQYTRPREFEGLEVPAVLTSGDHKKIADYQASERKRLTRDLRPDLLENESE